MEIRNQTDNMWLQIQKKQIRNVSTILKYLGALTSTNGNVKRKENKQSDCILSLYRLFCDKKEINHERKTITYESVLVPMIIYEDKSLLLTNRLNKK